MDEYLDHLHSIIWKYGRDGRILMGTLNDPRILKRLGEHIVRPTEARGKGKLLKVLIKYGQGQFEIDSNSNGECWVKSLRSADAIQLSSGSARTQVMDTSTERNGSQTSARAVINASKTFQIQNEKTTCHLIDNNQGLSSVVMQLNRYIQSKLSIRASEVARDDWFLNVPMVAMDCEGVPLDLQLFQIAIPDIDRDGKILVFLIDCQRIGATVVCSTLRSFLVNDDDSPNVLFKLIHDVHNDARAISSATERKPVSDGNNNGSKLSSPSNVSLNSVLDTQLLAEFITNDPFVGFNAMLSTLKLPTHPSKEFVHGRMRSGVDLWTTRPISRQALEYAALDVSLLLDVATTIRNILTPKDFDNLARASRQRVLSAISTKDDDKSSRSICFDKANNFRLASSELMMCTRPDDGFFGEPLRVQSDADEVLDILPRNLKGKLIAKNQILDHVTDIEQPTADSNPIQNIVNFIARPSRRHRDIDSENNEPFVDVDRLTDIVLDVGRRPQCWVDDRRVFMSDRKEKVVDQNDIDEVCTNLGRFGSDNRAGLSGKLHRFSRMLDRENNITGITVRIGRHVDGNAAMLMDFLMSSDKSILILGEPGSGKTTIVREATRKLAEDKNVIVVDTSNEIAGDGTLPHPCIGLARRMMVPSLDKQSSVMVECVQNHTPHIMVIDEIGRPKEVQAARTVKQRGVRMVASAHGSFRKLLKNKDLNGLIGGIESVTLGDEMAKEESKRKNKPISKTKVQRCSEPTFEVVVEVQRGSRNEWRIITDSALAVDQILDGLNYKAELRIRDPGTGKMRLAFVEG